MATPNHPDLGRKVQLKDSQPPITGTITEVTCAHTPSPLSAFKIYTVTIDPQCFNLTYDRSATWTEWNVHLL